MDDEETGLFFRSSIFSFSSKLILLFFGLLYTLLITNYLGPQEYGLIMYLMNLFGTVVLLFGNEMLQNILTVFIPRGYSQELLRRVFFFGGLLAFLLFILLFFAAGPAVTFLNLGNIGLFRKVSLIVFFMPFTLLFYSVFRGFKKFGKVLKLSFIETGSNLLLAVLLVLVMGVGLLGVLYAKLGSLALTLLFSIYYYKELSVMHEKRGNYAEIKKFAKGSFAVNFLKKSNEWVKLILMGLFLNPLFLGFYYLLQKISTYFIDAPMTALTEVLLPFASEKSSNKKQFERMISLNVKLFIMLSLLLSGIFVGIGGSLVVLLFPGYSESVYLIPFFALFCFLIFTHCFTTALKAINRNDIIAKGNFYTLFLFMIAGYFLTSQYLLIGILSAEIIRKTIFFIYTKVQFSKLGYKIEIIPRKKDLKYFYSLFKSQIKTHSPF